MNSVSMLRLVGCTDLQVLHKATRVVCVFIDGGTDPDVAVVAQDDTRSTR